MIPGLGRSGEENACGSWALKSPSLCGVTATGTGTESLKKQLMAEVHDSGLSQELSGFHAWRGCLCHYEAQETSQTCMAAEKKKAHTFQSLAATWEIFATIYSILLLLHCPLFVL